jgi:hypothetical protein
MVAKAKDGLGSMGTNLFSNFLPEKVGGYLHEISIKT